jgi:predicted XRE-type DNA-binding protein
LRWQRYCCEPTLKKIIQIEESYGGVHPNLGGSDAEQMLVKARRVTEVGELIKRKGLTQIRAAVLLGVPQPTISGTLRGQFSGAQKNFSPQSLSGRDLAAAKAATSSMLHCRYHLE